MAKAPLIKATLGWLFLTLPVCRDGRDLFKLKKEDCDMLDLRPNCECCDKGLPPESIEARICSFECTFCAACAEGTLGGQCPNCGGELVTRPRRPESKLAKFPASTQRVNKKLGCKEAA